MNNDLISRSALKKKLQARHDNGEKDFDKGYNIGIETAVELIDSAPTISPYKAIHDELNKEEPKGKWIIIKSPLSNETIVKCDKCGDEFIGNDVEDYNFCPICGADMRGEDE